MARLLVTASSEKLQISSAVLTGMPLAMACWSRLTSTSGNYVSLCLSTIGTTTNAYYLSTESGTPRAYSVSSGGGGFVKADASTTVGSGTWYHHLGVWASATDRRCLLNGGNKGTNASSSTPAGTIDTTTIGVLARPTPAGYFGGRIADAAIWDLSVWPGATDTARCDNFETSVAAALAAGISPLRFSLGLVGYWPLWGDHSPEIDLHPRANDANDYSLTLTGTAKANHAPLEPYSRFRGSVPLIEAGGGGASALTQLILLGVGS